MAKSPDATGAPTRRRIIKAAGALAAGIAAPAVLRIGSALAAYPDRPVRIVVANTPGGPSDIIARIMAAAMQEAMGGSFIVENKGGAGGNIGMGTAARAEPDGYTILLSTSAYWSIPGLYNTLPYDPFKDFVAVCELAASPHVFAVKPELGASTMKEFVALAKKPIRTSSTSRRRRSARRRSWQAEVLKLREGLQRMATVVFRAAATRSRRCSRHRADRAPACWRPRIRRSRPGPSRGSRSPAGDPLARPARNSDHGGVGLPGFVFETYTALVAPGEDAAGDRRQAREGRARDPGQARDAREARRSRASRCRPRTARTTWRASPRRCRCSATSSPRPASRSCSGRRHCRRTDGLRPRSTIGRRDCAASAAWVMRSSRRSAKGGSRASTR